MNNFNYAAYIMHICGVNDKIKKISTIVEKRAIDVNATSAYIFRQFPASRPFPIEGASPLFVAAGNGNLEISKYLIEKGANVNYRTVSTLPDIYAGMSPLHAAISLRREIEFPKRRAMIELILANGANLQARDDYGLTPLNVAAMGYPRDESHCSPNDAVLRYLLEMDDFSLLEKIDALDLAGAIIIFYKEESIPVSQVFKYWNEALDLRETSQGAIPKVPLEVINNVHWRSTEWTTRDELRELQQRNSFPGLMMQAILVTKRIMSRISLRGLVHHFWNRFVFNYRSRLYQVNRITELLDIYWIMLEGVRVVPQCDNHSSGMIIKIVKDLVSFLKKLKFETSPILNSETLKLSLELISDTVVSHINVADHYAVDFEPFQIIRPTHMMYDLVTILSGSTEMLTNEIKLCLHQFVRRDQRDKLGCNLLLFACNQLATTDTISAVRLLLQAGADPNAVDEKGNSPLHHVASWMREAESDSPTADLLLEHGALPNQSNYSNETPLDIWTRQNERPGRILYPPAWRFTVVTPLMWWCARSIRRNKTPYKHLPESLQDFVSNHY